MGGVSSVSNDGVKYIKMRLPSKIHKLLKVRAAESEVGLEAMCVGIVSEFAETGRVKQGGR